MKKVDKIGTSNHAKNDVNYTHRPQENEVHYEQKTEDKNNNGR